MVKINKKDNTIRTEHKDRTLWTRYQATF